MMSLNKTIWHQAMRYYREWNEAKSLEEIITAGQMTITEKWQRYCQLHALGRLIKPEPSLWEQQQIADEWQAYYHSIQTFEDWRRRHGRTT